MQSPLAALAAFSLVLAPTAAHAEAPLTLDDLSIEHRQHVTCMMLAGVAVSEFERGVRKDSYGLGQDDLERLGEALAATLAAAYGADTEQTRALIKAEFEFQSARSMEFAEDDVKGPAAQFEKLAGECQPLWAAGAIPPAPTYRDKPVDAHFCFALEHTFAQALSSQPEIGAVFAGRASRIEAGLLEEAGDDETARRTISEDLMTFATGFDDASWDALPEAEAEKIMTWCDKLAGPDE